jgi:hypothetical protein
MRNKRIYIDYTVSDNISFCVFRQVFAGEANVLGNKKRASKKEAQKGGRRARRSSSGTKRGRQN